ncbi:MAG TPA: MFS transporter [Candidatus Limnocylindrales bacterium]|nr:MFS transporter [Candidatus Limnocylindrales bacterium]
MPGPPDVTPGLVPRAPGTPRGPASPWPRALSAFRHRNFRLFWSGQLVSLVGTWMQQVAQGWLVLELTGDPLALGITAACQFLPVLAFGLFGGVLADALPKRRTLVAAQAGALALALALGILTGSGLVQVWQVWLLAALLGLVNAIEMPVRQAFVMEMVGREDVANAVALNSAVFNGSRIVGPALAGLLIAAAGIAVCFFVNAASYVAVMIGLLLMRDEELRATASARFERTMRGVGGQLAEGLRYVRDTPIVRLSILLLGFVATVGMNFSVLMPVLVRVELHGSAETYGFLLAASGVGSLAAAVGIALGMRPTPRLLVTGAGVFGAALLGVALSRSVPLTLVLMVLLGWGVIALAATTNTLIQLNVPDVLRGRVMSVYTTVFAGSTPIGGVFAGSVAAAAGVPLALGLGGLLALGAAAVAATRLPRLAGARGSQAAGPEPR